jgi:hypothetical protein
MAKWRPHGVGCEEVKLLKSDGHRLERYPELIGKRVEGVSAETVGSGEFAGSHPHRLPPWTNIPYVCSEEREGRSVVQFERTGMESRPERGANIVFRHAEMGRKRVGLLLKVRSALVVPAAIQWWIAVQFRHVRVHHEVARFVGYREAHDLCPECARKHHKSIPRDEDPRIRPWTPVSPTSREFFVLLDPEAIQLEELACIVGRAGI